MNVPEGIAAHSFEMLGQIIYFEFRMKYPDASSEDWDIYAQRYAQPKDYGRELLDRKFIKLFGTPVTINRDIRRALIRTMAQFEKELPQQKGPNFEAKLKQLIIEDSSS